MCVEINKLGVPSIRKWLADKTLLCTYIRFRTFKGSDSTCICTMLAAMVFYGHAVWVEEGRKGTPSSHMYGKRGGNTSRDSVSIQTERMRSRSL